MSEADPITTNLYGDVNRRCEAAIFDGFGLNTKTKQCKRFAKRERFGGLNVCQQHYDAREVLKYKGDML